jgi:ubiquinone/menaquinone biosynthesis C-methylase UbiE
MTDQLHSDGFNDIAKKYDNEDAFKFSDGLYNTLLTKEWFQHLHDAQMLDFGCGTGNNAINFYPQFNQITGVDISDKMIEVFLKKVDDRNMGDKIKGFAIGEDPSEELGGKSFDLVLASLMLHHAANPVATVTLFSSLTKVGGRIVIMEFNPPSKDNVPSHTNPELSDDIINTIISNGFEFESTDYFRIITSTIFGHRHNQKTHKHGEHDHHHEEHGQHHHGEPDYEHNHGEHSHGEQCNHGHHEEHSHGHHEEHSHGEHSHHHGEHSHGEQCKHGHHEEHGHHHGEHGQHHEEHTQHHNESQGHHHGEDHIHHSGDHENINSDPSNQEKDFEEKTRKRREREFSVGIFVFKKL